MEQRTGWFARAARLKTLPVGLWPVAFGATYAMSGPGLLVFGPSALRAVAASIIAAGLLHIAIALVDDVNDQTSGSAKIARMERGSVPIGTDAIADGKTSASAVRTMIVLVMAASAVLWALSGDGWILGTVAVLLGPRWSKIPAILGEFVSAAARAGLTCAAVCVSIGQVPSSRVVAISIIPSAFAFISIGAEGLLQWRADRAVARRTMAARLEVERTLVVLGAAITAAFVLLVLEVGFNVLPRWSLLALAAAAPLSGAWGRAYRDPAPQHLLRLLGATLGASLLVGVALIAGIALS